LSLHILHARRNLGLRKVVPDAEHRRKSGRHYSRQFFADDLVALTVVTTAFRVSNNHRRDDSDEVLLRAIRP